MNWQSVFSFWPERTSTDWLTILSQLTKAQIGSCWLFLDVQIDSPSPKSLVQSPERFELIEKDGEPEGQSSRRLLSENLNPTQSYSLSFTSHSVVFYRNPTSLFSSFFPFHVVVCSYSACCIFILVGSWNVLCLERITIFLCIA